MSSPFEELARFASDGDADLRVLEEYDVNYSVLCRC